MKRRFKPLAYLASPYSHEDELVRLQRYEDITRIAAYLTERGQVLICPITTSHNIQKYMSNKSFGFAGFWELIDFNYIDRCDEMIVAMMDGWKESVGVQAEIRYATYRGMRIRYFNAYKMSFSSYES